MDKTIEGKFKSLEQQLLDQIREIRSEYSFNSFPLPFEDVYIAR